MNMSSENQPPRNRTMQYRSLILAALIIAILAAGAWVDYDWTEWLGQHRMPYLVAVMGRTLFEGELPGANDPVILVLIAAALAHYVGWKRPGITGPARWRPETGFILVGALITAVLLVHGLKWVVGRARPDLVFNHGFPFTHWFSFGPHYITDGIFRGAFPSGHTAQTFALMTGAYALAGSPAAGTGRRIIGICLGIAVVALSLTMGAARCMSLSHWVTDVLGSVGIGWLLIHLTYFQLLRVPEQIRFIMAYHRQPGLPDVWELRICLFLCLATMGAMTIALGVRGLFLGKGLWFAGGVPLGGILLWWSTTRILAVHRLVGLLLSVPTESPTA